MKLTVIYDDRFIGVDGYGLNFYEDWPFEEEDIHAIQWQETRGWIEYRDTSENKELEHVADVQKYYDHFQQQKIIIEEKLRLEEEEARKQQESWHLAMQELQQELNEVKMNYDMAVSIGEQTHQNLLKANQVNLEIQRMHELLLEDQLGQGDAFVNDIVQPDTMDDINKFGDTVDMSLFDEVDGVASTEEKRLLDIHSDEFDLSLLEDEFNIDLMEEGVDESTENSSLVDDNNYAFSLEELLHALGTDEEFSSDTEESSYVKIIPEEKEITDVFIEQISEEDIDQLLEEIDKE